MFISLLPLFDGHYCFTTSLSIAKSKGSEHAIHFFAIYFRVEIPPNGQRIVWFALYIRIFLFSQCNCSLSSPSFTDVGLWTSVIFILERIIQVQSFSIQSLYSWTKLTRRNERHLIIKLCTYIICHRGFFAAAMANFIIFHETILVFTIFEPKWFLEVTKFR